MSDCCVCQVGTGHRLLCETHVRQWVGSTYQTRAIASKWRVQVFDDWVSMKRLEILNGTVPVVSK